MHEIEASRVFFIHEIDSLCQCLGLRFWGKPQKRFEKFPLSAKHITATQGVPPEKPYLRATVPTLLEQTTRHG